MFSNAGQTIISRLLDNEHSKKGKKPAFDFFDSSFPGNKKQFSSVNHPALVGFHSTRAMITELLCH
jgi:hypothetical protein